MISLTTLKEGLIACTPSPYGDIYMNRDEHIFYCGTESIFAIDHFYTPNHYIMHMHEGNMEYTGEDGRHYLLKKGDTYFIAAHQKIRYRSLMKPGEKLRLLAVNLTWRFLRDFYLKHQNNAAKAFSKDMDMMADHALLFERLCDAFVNGTAVPTGNGNRIIKLDENGLFNGLFIPVHSYFKNKTALSVELMRIKTTEALLLLKSMLPEAYGILFNFSSIGRHNLKDFMENTYSFNVSLEVFARVSGRTLSTFKRDFEKIFNMPPNKWLVKKRLETAYQLIRERKEKPSEVYRKVGFEYLSHFSAAFKREFGCNPSDIRPE